MSYRNVHTDKMDLDDLNFAILEIGASKMAQAVDWSIQEGIGGPSIILSEPYNMVFEDPTKPPETVFRRFQCHEGDIFHLSGIRETPKNFIFQFTPGDNVKRNLARHKVGPGLKTEWSKAELTMSLMNEKRMNASMFMRSSIQMYRNFAIEGLKEDKMYADVSAGSW